MLPLPTAGCSCLLLLLASLTAADIPSGLDLSLLKTLTSSLGDNQAISPFVLSSLLSQIWLGVTGDTRDQISQALGLNVSSQLAAAEQFVPAYKSAIAGLSARGGNATATTVVFNRIYVRSGVVINPNLSQLLHVVFGSSVRQFTSATQAAVEINTDVARATRGRIRNLVSADSLQQLGMALVGALYFKDQWRWTFRKSGVKESFLTASGSKRVNMMRLQRNLRYSRLGAFDALELPYRDEQYCMLLLRPRERSMAAVRKLISKLDSLNISDILKHLITHKVRVSMPRFKMDVTYSLRNALSVLGVKELFSIQPDSKGIGRFPQLASDIHHRVFIEVNEEGTEAAGAAITLVYLMASQYPIIDFRLDRPFVAILYNKRYNFNMFSAYVGSPQNV